jgi:hypothetical protein
LSGNNKKLIEQSDVSYDCIFDIKDEILKLNLIEEKDDIIVDYKYIRKVENICLKENVFHLGLKDFAINNIDSPRLHYYQPKNKNILGKYYEIILKKFEAVINFKNYHIIYSAGTSNLVRNIFLSYCRKKKIPFFSARQRFALTYLSECSMNLSNVRYLRQNKFAISKKNTFIYNKSNTVFNHSNLFGLFSLLNFLLNLLFYPFFRLIIDDFKSRVKFSRPNYFQNKNRFAITFHIIKDIFNKFLIQRYIMKNLSTKMKIIKSSKFIYFPLHTIPEGGVFDQNDYVDESFLIYEKLDIN